MKKRFTAFLIVFITVLSLVCPAYAEGTASYIVIESATGQAVSESNADAPLPAAGMVRLMSLLIIGEQLANGSLTADESVTVSAEAAHQGGSTVFLDAGENCTLGELYKAAVIAGANDAVYAMAEHISGSEAAFTELMNKKAGELGLSCTFSDCTGLTEQAMTARDVALICIGLCACPEFFKHSSTWLSEFTHNSGRTTQMSSSNILIKEDFDGMATSSSSSAGYCLAASKKAGASRFICVVLGDTKNGRFQSARELTNTAASSYTSVNIAQKGMAVTQTEVEGIKEPVKLAANDDLSLLLTKEAAKGLKKEVKLNELKPPLSAGSAAGELIITLPDGQTHSVQLVIAEDIAENGFISVFKRILHYWLCR